MNSEKDLYNKLLPALRCKKHELELNNIDIVSTMNIWKYNKEYNWKVKGLTIAKMVDDILNTPDKMYYDYVVKKIKESERNG